MARLQSQKRKKQIVKAAISLFSQRGFRGTKTRDIAGKAHISEALLFKHFPNKSSLYEAILQYKMKEKIPLLLAGLDKLRKPEQVFLEVALRMVTVHEKDPTFFRLLHFSTLEGHELSDLFFQKRNLPVRAFLKNYLKKENQRGTLKGLDPEKTVSAFMALLSGYLMMRLLFRIPQIVKASPKSYLSHYVKVFLEGITP